MPGLSEQIAKAVRRQRLDKGWTQNYLADEAGVTQFHIWRIEAGIGGVTTTTLSKVACALGLEWKLELVSSNRREVLDKSLTAWYNGK